MSSLPLAVHAANLPTPRSPLVGRASEIAAARALLVEDAVPLLTLTGPGGVGKTRLALAVAAALAEATAPSTHSGRAFADGVVFVDLAPVRDPALMPAAVAQALGMRESRSRRLPDDLVARLRPRQLLLVLDNCEHLLGAVPWVGELLSACPALQVLATSRASLRLRGEHDFPVPLLDVADPARLPPLAELARTEAVALFVQRAHAANPSFTLTEANAPAVAEICARLDGLPLALELAAVRLKLLSPPALLALLTDRLTLLTAGARDAPARQRTLRDTVAWSYDLLAADAQALFRRLAVFPGGFTLEAAERVMGDGEWVIGLAPSPSPITHSPSPRSVLDGLGALVDQSLLRHADAPDGTPRFAMLETIREYGLERLEASGEAEPARRQHAGYVLALVEQPEQPPRQRRWLDQVEAAQADLRAALAWGLDRDVELALRLGGALWPFWSVRGHLSEGRRWLERALDRGAEAPAPARLQALYGASRLAATQGDAVRAVAYAEESLTLATAVGDRRSVGRALDQLSTVAMLQGDYARARALLAETLAIAQAVADKMGLARVWHGLGVVEGRQGNYDLATAHSAAALALYRELDDHVRVAQSLQNLGLWADYSGDRAGAASRYAEALALNRELVFKVGIGRDLTKLGNLFARGGEGARAIEYYAEALPIHRDHGDRPEAAEALMGLGVVAVERGDAEQAARLFGAATALGEAAGYALHPPLKIWHDGALAAVRAALGDARFGAAWDAGRALSLDQAVAEALAFAAATTPVDTPVTPTAPAASPAPYALSEREREVLRLVARRLTDKEIGEALSISHRTAMTHVTHILNKLGVASRREAAAVAARDGLV